ncbi:hypothetical protein [Nonomuraea rubra]|uniref:Uncharacterized protein n=1 Tax=Nonomuraea rubra TaxID=46180 RepID=A0A7X0P6F2_9ACTN|nr:hypothetical protein [Nonomuraea rubra]MBB6556148.1 hypothetical protein [Nonomuraea rubra]
MAIDYSTDRGRIRLLIPDTDEDNLLLIDPQIDAFLSMEGSVKLAAAAALDVIASSEVLVSKVIRTQDLQTDGAKVAAELRARAAGLRQQVDDGVGDDTVGFDVVDFDRWAGYARYEP